MTTALGSLLLFVALQGEADASAAPAPEAEGPAAEAPAEEASAEAAPAEEAPPEEDAGEEAPAEAPASEEPASEEPAPAEQAAAKEGPRPADEGPQCKEMETTALTIEACTAFLEAKKKEEEAAKAEAEKKRKEGFWWDKNLNVGASALGLFNRSFVGQQDGLTLQFGGFANGGLTLGYAGHEWTSTFKVEESMIGQPTGTELVPIFVKAADEALVNTEYKFRWALVPWVGPFAKGEGRSQIFPGWLLRKEPTSFVKTNLDGSVELDSVGANTPVFLTSWFEPLTLSETAGVFIEPPNFAPWITYSFKAAAAANHIIALGGYVPADNPDTPELELNQIGVVNSAGVQGEAKVAGAVFEQVTWGLNAIVYYPILAVGANVDKVNLLERTHVDVDAIVSVKLIKWLSIDGVVKVRRQPFVLNDWQLQTSLLLTAGFNVL